MKSTFNIAIALSQSLGQGNTGPANPLYPSPIPDPAKAKEYLFTQVGTSGGNGSFVSLFDPMSRDKQPASTNPTRRSNPGSPWPAMACRLIELTGANLNVAHYAVSGSTVAQQPASSSNQNWSLNGVNGVGVLRAAARLHIQKMLDAQGVGTPLDWLVSVIGETEFYGWLVRYPTQLAIFPNGYVCPEFPAGYDNTTNRTALYDLYAEAITWFQTQFPGLKVCLVGTGPWENRTAAERTMGAYANVVKRELAANLPNVFYCPLPEVYSVAGGHIRPAPDTVHNTQSGANKTGVAVAEFIAAVESEAAIAPL